MRYRILFGCLGMLLLLSACSKGTPTPTATPGPAATPTTAASPTPTTAAVTPIAFFLELTSPVDESVVQGTSVEVVGKTVADAVVSVNGQTVDVDADGGFSAIVPLQEGPNTIEVVASDFSGNQSSKVITVVAIS